MASQVHVLRGPRRPYHEKADGAQLPRQFRTRGPAGEGAHPRPARARSRVRRVLSLRGVQPDNAGGLLDGADTSKINLAKVVSDEMTIIIYSKKEVEDYLNGKDELEQRLAICEDKLKNNACINNKNNNINTSLININQGTKEELMTLPGIGEAKASAIIEYRNKTPFKSIEDLLNVDGIGDSLFESIKENITI